MSSKLKITEIAHQTGLSASTVSRVLAGKANTSARAKRLVLECARECGVLETVGGGRLLFNRLLVFAPTRAFDRQADVFYYQMIQGLREAVAPHDIHLSYCPLEENNSDAPQFLRRLSEPATEAALVIGVDDPHIHEIAADLGKPCVLMNCRDPSMRLDTVLPDHRQLGEFSARHLLRLGHRDILTVTSLRRFTLEQRLDGIREAFRAHNLEFNEERHLLVTNGFSAAEAGEALTAWLASHPLPAALIASGDFIAEGLIQTLQGRGLRVPRDASVLSIDAPNLASIGPLALSATRVPREQLSIEALALLQRRISRPGAPVCNLLVGGKLAAGGTVRQASRRGSQPGSAEHELYR